MSPDDDDDRDPHERVASPSPGSSSPASSPGRRPITIQIPPKRQHGETRGRLPLRDSRPLPAPVAAPAPAPADGDGDADVDEAARTLRLLETADTGDVDIAIEDTAPQDPARAAAVTSAVLAGAALTMPLGPLGPLGLPAGSAPRDAGEGPFFAPLPADRRAAVLARFHRRQLAPGTLVIHQGETQHPLYLVAHGLLEVRAERPDGQLVPLDHIRAGDVVGEIGLLTRTPSPFQVIAATAVDALALGPKDFYDIVGAFPALWAYLKDLSERRAREYESRSRR